MRLAAAALPPGQRLPVPEARDELRAMAEAINGLLARRDEARQRLQRFTGDAAHELRSPVASIRAQAEVAVLHPDAGFAQEVLADVVAESERLSTLIDDLLVLSRSDAGELPTAGPVDLALAAPGRGRTGCRRTGPRCGCACRRTRRRCGPRPARWNWCWTTCCATRCGTRGLMCRVFVLPTVGGVRLLVDDDGPGVPEEHRSRVFDRFYRVHDDRGRATGGFGLGLALVAEVVRRRGGTVAVGESPDGGARFEARWPGSPTR